MELHKTNYKVGDSVVSPMHGAVTIESVQEKSILGKKQLYYVMKMPITEMTVMIPTNSINEVGLRDVISTEDAKILLAKFDNLDYQFVDNIPWSKRYRDNMDLIKTGDIYNLVQVTKSLMVRDKIKGLCTAEKKMLSSVKKMLISELMLSKVGTYDQIQEFLFNAVSKMVNNFRSSVEHTDDTLVSS